MPTLIASNILTVSKILEAAGRISIEIKTRESAADTFYIIDCNQTEGVEAAESVKTEKPHATVLCFYPHVRREVKEQLEAIGCKAYTNAEFFAKLPEILKSSGNK